MYCLRDRHWGSIQRRRWDNADAGDDAVGVRVLWCWGGGGGMEWLETAVCACFLCGWVAGGGFAGRPGCVKRVIHLGCSTNRSVRGPCLNLKIAAGVPSNSISARAAGLDRNCVKCALSENESSLRSMWTKEKRRSIQRRGSSVEASKRDVLGAFCAKRATCRPTTAFRPPLPLVRLGEDAGRSIDPN